MNADNIRVRIVSPAGRVLSAAGASDSQSLRFVAPANPTPNEIFWFNMSTGTDGVTRGGLRRNFSATGGERESGEPFPRLLDMFSEDEQLQRTDPALKTRLSKRGADATSQSPERKPHWITRTLSGRRLDTLYAQYDSTVAVSTSGANPVDPALRVPPQGIFQVTTPDGTPPVLSNLRSLRLALAFRERSGTNVRWLVDDSGAVLLQSAPAGAAPPMAAWLTVVLTTPLKLHFGESQVDHFLAAAPESLAECAAGGYRLLHTEGEVFMSAVTPELVPLETFHHPGRRDHAVAATLEGKRRLFAAGYQWLRTEGYVQAREHPDAVPLRAYENPAITDTLVTCGGSAKERETFPAGYRFRGDEGFVLPNAELLVALPLPLGVPILTPTAAGLPAGATPTLRPTARGAGAPRLRHKTALVLSGGGAKGAFEVGAAKRLWETVFRDRKPDIITGVSVGALNAAKLGEGRSESAAELEDIWRGLGGPNGQRVFEEPGLAAYGDLLAKFAVDHVDDAVDNGDVASSLSQIVFPRLLTMLSMVQSLYSMAPLRQLIASRLNLANLLASPCELRIGLTDAKSGQLLSVGKPLRASGAFAGWGLVENEQDNSVGANWLNRPIHGATRYAMHFADAVYASAVMPVFMDPSVLNLMEGVQVERIDGQPTCMLPRTYSPFPSDVLQRALAARRQAVRPWDELGDMQTVYNQIRTETGVFKRSFMRQQQYSVERGHYGSGQRLLFDGGLRDTMAIRTAIRAGAREIYIVSGDRLGSFSAPFGEPELATPIPDYLIGLLGVWNNDAARNDIMQSLSANEFMGWLYRSAATMDAAEKARIVQAFNRYWADQGSALRRHLGAGTFAGGAAGFVAQPGAIASGAIGSPFFDEGCQIHMVYPPRDVLASTDMHNRPGIAEAIELGYEAARQPATLSNPVPDALLGG